MEGQLRLSDDMPEVKEVQKPRSDIQRIKQQINFRKSETKETCKNCVHTTYTREESYKHPATGKQITYIQYFKCRKCPHIGFSRGEATDIKKGHICDLFKRQEE